MGRDRENKWVGGGRGRAMGGNGACDTACSFIVMKQTELSIHCHAQMIYMWIALGCEAFSKTLISAVSLVIHNSEISTFTCQKLICCSDGLNPKCSHHTILTVSVYWSMLCDRGWLHDLSECEEVFTRASVRQFLWLSFQKERYTSCGPVQIGRKESV